MKQPLDTIRDSALEAQARALYDPALPYHNFEHIEDTLAAADLILARCYAENIRINAEVVYYALLFHDAGYHEDHQSLGFASKEDYSAALAERILAAAARPATVIKKTVAAIKATERDASFVTAEQKAVRAADLSGMAAPWPEFLQKSLKLKEEVAVLSGQPVDWQTWQATSNEVLGFYLTQEIRLTSYFHNQRGESEFHSAVRDNLARLLAEPEEPQPAPH